MQSNHEPFRAITRGVILVCLILFSPVNAVSQHDNLTSRKCIVGAIVLPPSFMKTADNRWEGFSVELWQTIAQRVGVSYEFREFNSLESMLKALENKEIDVIPSLAVQERFEPVMD